MNRGPDIVVVPGDRAGLDREHHSVLRAYAVGAVACAHCQAVHVDFTDESNNVIATGSLPFDAWALLVAETDTKNFMKTPHGRAKS